MRNHEIAAVLNSIADLLEFKWEMVFTVRAYQRAARAIDHYPEEVSSLAEDFKKLQALPGVGKEIAKQTQELVTTGRLEYYERLESEFPEGITAIMDIPGVGPKTTCRLAEELGGTSTEALHEALDRGLVAALPRLGEKTAENIWRNLEPLRHKDTRTPLGTALPVVERLLDAVQGEGALQDLTAAGNVRRFRETVGDIDLLGTAQDSEKAITAFIRLPGVTRVLGQSTTKASVVLTSGLQVDFRVLDEERFGTLIQYFTGSKEHNVLLRERARRSGLNLSDLSITRLEDGTEETFYAEEEVYARLGLAWVPPDLREDRGEVEAAVQETLPALVEVRDLQGDLDIHTDWSDGDNSLEVLAEEAAQRGYSYIAITDHSVGRGIARGLSAEWLMQQREAIQELRGRHPNLVILHGSEVDIRANCSLDYPDDILQCLDFVIGSIHSGMQQGLEQMTVRIIRAMENTYLTVVGHLTDRLLGEREPIDVDVEAVFQAARRTGTALEINASPNQLDLKDSHIYRARELGVPLIISTDAHAPHDLDFMRFGLGTTRRGWCAAHAIMNTRPWHEFREFLDRKRQPTQGGVRV